MGRQGWVILHGENRSDRGRLDAKLFRFCSDSPQVRAQLQITGSGQNQQRRLFHDTEVYHSIDLLPKSCYIVPSSVSKLSRLCIFQTINLYLHPHCNLDIQGMESTSFTIQGVCAQEMVLQIAKACKTEHHPIDVHFLGMF